MFQLRMYQSEDTELCRKLILSCIRHMSGMEAQAHAQIEYKEQRFPLEMEMSSCYSMVICKFQEIVALGVLDKNIIKRLCVSPNHHKIGLGRQLMMALEEKAKSQGVKKIRLDSSENAVKFFKKIGYQVQYPKIWQLGGTKIKNTVMGKELI